MPRLGPEVKEDDGSHRERLSLRLERNVLSLSAEMTLAPVTFSTTSHQSVLFFILPGYTSASEIRGLLVLGSPDSTFSSILLQGAIRICPQNTRGEHGHRGPGEGLSLLWIRHLQIKTFVPLSPQSPVVHTH